MYIPTKQAGAALVVCLVLMLLLTVISANALRSTTLQERMAGNERDTLAAFQAAEAGLRAAEQLLESSATLSFNGSGGLFSFCDDANQTKCNPPDWGDRSATNWRAVTSFSSALDSDPQFYIEEYGELSTKVASLAADAPPETFTMYRITARGFGLSDSSMVVLRAFYRRKQ
ncbi:PilX N-terminal domain-containing pilus assembly protein [Litorivivens sp.]|uniref:pilus assembly PilX family protein n=2 Tax=Litorivivens sp. TaxID=2020868 RepID=UPI00356AE2E5